MKDSNFLPVLRKIRTCIFILASNLVLTATAADDSDLTEFVGDVETTQPSQPDVAFRDLSPDDEVLIEEITVTGQRLISHLKIEVLRAEDRAWDLFNELNDDNQYDIHCRMEAPTGTRIKYRQCAPNFYLKAEAHASSIARSGVLIDIRPKLATKYKELKEEMMKKMLENPELLDAFLEAQELREELGYTINSYWDRKSRTP